MGRERGNPGKHLGAGRSDDVDLSHLILMTKKLGVCGCPPEPLFGLDKGDSICIWVKTKRKIDRLPKTRRSCQGGHSGQHLHRLKFTATDFGEDHGHTGKYFVP